MATGKFNTEQKADIEKFLLSLNEEQDKLFKKLVLDKNKVLKIKK
jgi:hypothetical protein